MCLSTTKIWNKKIVIAVNLLAIPICNINDANIKWKETYNKNHWNENRFEEDVSRHSLSRLRYTERQPAVITSGQILLLHRSWCILRDKIHLKYPDIDNFVYICRVIGRAMIARISYFRYLSMSNQHWKLFTMNSWSAYKPRARHHLLVWVHAAHKIAHNHDLVYNIVDFTRHNIADTSWLFWPPQ